VGENKRPERQFACLRPDITAEFAKLSEFEPIVGKNRSEAGSEIVFLRLPYLGNSPSSVSVVALLRRGCPALVKEQVERSRSSMPSPPSVQGRKPERWHPDNHSFGFLLFH
jgi:hypothetical protein